MKPEERANITRQELVVLIEALRHIVEDAQDARYTREESGSAKVTWTSINEAKRALLMLTGS